MATYYVDGAVGDDGNAGTSEGAGNAWATIQHALDYGSLAAGDTIYVKASASYTEDLDIDGTDGTGAAPITLEGYTSTPGDGGRATIEGGNTRTNCIGTMTADWYHIKNFIMQDSTGYIISGSDISPGYLIKNCVLRKNTGAPTRGINSLRYSTIEDCEIYGMSAYGIANYVCNVHNCRIYDCGSDGIRSDSWTGGCFFVGNMIWDCAGYGIRIDDNNAHPILVEHNTIYSCDSGGILIGNSNIGKPGVCAHNLLCNNTGYGLNVEDTPDSTYVWWFDHNAFYGNSSGSYNSSRGVGVNDVAVTDGSPFESVDDSSEDFLKLNDTALRGALVRNAGAWNQDIGAWQHDDPEGGGGGLLFHPFFASNFIR